MSVAAAADPPDEERSSARPVPLFTYELTPFIGYRLSGDFDIANTNPKQRANLDDHGSFGLAFDVRRDEVSQYELFYSRQEGQLEKNSPLAPLDVNVEYLHNGGTLDLNDELAIRPYLDGTL
jgi:hypothetical protein